MTAMADAPDMIHPAHLWIPDRVSSAGQETIDLAASCGITLDPEQCLAIDALLSEVPGGKWAALEGAVIEPRQNGKTGGIILPIVLADLFLFGTQLIVWTSHRFKTSQESFHELRLIVEANDHLRKRVKHIRTANGDEGIDLITGSRVQFLARSKGAGRGLSGDRVILDEAYDLSAQDMGSLLPTLSARPNPQVIYGSSAGQDHSEVLRSIRDRGRIGNDPSLVYVEWCAPGSWDEPPCQVGFACNHVRGIAGCALDRQEFWRAANPAIGRRIPYNFIAAERRALPPAEFARERLGWWDQPATGLQPIDPATWATCSVGRDARPDGAPVFFVDVAYGMRSCAIAVAATRHGVPHVELADQRANTDWVVPRILELRARHPRARVGGFTNHAVGALVPELAAAGVELEKMNDSDMGRACAHLEKLVPGGMTHSGDPLLMVAIGGAVKREIGEGLWSWGRRKSVTDISPLVAATGALWLLAQEKPSAPIPDFFFV
jgi:phage terminase large subunit-like protein